MFEISDLDYLCYAIFSGLQMQLRNDNISRLLYIWLFFIYWAAYLYLVAANKRSMALKSCDNFDFRFEISDPNNLYDHAFVDSI